MTTLLHHTDTILALREDYLHSYTHAALIQGRGVVIIVDGTASLFHAASRSTTAATAFAIRHGSGLLRVALPYLRTEHLAIPSMDTSFNPTAERMCVSVDAATGITTGISALDRSRTARILANPESTPSDLLRPGHLMVTAVDELTEPTTASGIAVKATTLSGLGAAAVLTELVGIRNPTDMMYADEAAQFAAAHEIPILTLATD
ncbi:3,4-dihydroxy-2-butanone-4-phosphate synthase [Gordonia terrae]